MGARGVGAGVSNLERFLDKVKFTDTCWLWMDQMFDSGYPRFNMRYKSHRAHRLSYRNFVGPIRDKYEIHHLCNVKRCVNPDHLIMVHPTVHKRLTAGWYLRNGKWYCKRNHRVQETAWENGQCGECRNEVRRGST